MHGWLSMHRHGLTATAPSVGIRLTAPARRAIKQAATARTPWLDREMHMLGRASVTAGNNAIDREMLCSLLE